jgi:tripartite-type tricarboxylate transporter receptor subunit TctC
MVLAPAGTPAPIINRLADEMRLILGKDDLKAKMWEAGFIIKYEGPDELHARMVREIPVWNEIVDRAGIAKKVAE